VTQAGGDPLAIGHWEVEVARRGTYTITLRFAPTRSPGPARLTLRDVTREKDLPAEATECTFESVTLTPGPGRLEAVIGPGDRAYGPLYVEVTRSD
jgi:hypothetical protein